jgi:phospholipid/cholesterol/gamma-HCH transport system permease protein
MTDVTARPENRDAEPTTRPNAPAKSANTQRLESAGHFMKFMLQTLREIPVAIRLYPSEIMRHCGVLIRQNSLVILFMLFMLGAIFGVTTHFLFSNLGIDSYIAAVPAIASMRGTIQVVFGWIVAAKFGCGIVAELGAMRISDEIDALEVMGVRPVPFLASTRVIAAAIVLPLIFVCGLLINFVAAYLFNVELLNTVSSGGFTYFLFLFQNAKDFVIAVVWASVLGLMITIVACYYGYTAKGGPVGVGRHTAQSMLINLVGISILSMMLVQLFYGNEPNAPIGN